MATKSLINGKYVQRAGVFSTIKSAIRNTTNQNSYRNILIIDDGIGAGFGGGSGVNGAYKQGSNSVYTFDSPEQFKAFVKGGTLWSLAKPLFNPAVGQLGVGKIFFVRAATTTAADINVAVTNGSFHIKTKDEGLNANGVLVSGNLTQGIAAKLVKNAATGKFKLQLWHGTYTGLDATNNTPYDGVLQAQAKPQLLVESPEVVLVADLVAWMQSNATFNVGFELQAGSTATGNFVDADLVTYPSYILAAGATESYGSTDFDAALAVVNNQDYVHILSMKYGANAQDPNNDKLVDFVKKNGTSKYDRILVIAGGKDKAERTSVTKVATAHFNNDSVIIVHGAVKKTSRAIGGFNIYSQLWHAAAVLGRTAGLPPEVPVTLKSIDIDGVVDSLEDQDLEDLISMGAVGSYYDHELELFVVGLDVTSIQSNEFLINDDGATYSWQLKRIVADTNKFIVITGKKHFFDPNGLGGNRLESSPEEVTVWAQKQLASKVGTTLVNYKNVAASLTQDIVNLTYDLVANTEVKQIISTGTLIEG